MLVFNLQRVDRYAKDPVIFQFYADAFLFIVYLSNILHSDFCFAEPVIPPYYQGTVINRKTVDWFL